MDDRQLQNRVKRLESLLALLQSKGGVTPQPLWLQGDQIIDPQNASGVASSTGSSRTTVVDSGGTSRTGPVWDSYRSLSRAWGTLAPYLTLSTTLVQMSDHTDDSDPVIWRPIINDGVIVTYTGTVPTVVRTDSITGVAAINRAAGSNSMQKANLNAGTTTGRRLFNTTHPSVCFAYYTAAAPLWNVTAPVAKATVTAPIPAPVTTWANGDSVQEQHAIQVDLAEFTPFSAGGYVSGYGLVLGIDVFDPNPSLQASCVIGSDTTSMLVSEVSFQRFPFSEGNGVLWSNCWYVVGGQFSGFSQIWQSGGCDPVQNTFFVVDTYGQESFFDQDFVMGGADFAFLLGTTGRISFGYVCLDSVIELNVGNLYAYTNGGSHQTVYGGPSKSGVHRNIVLQGSSRLVYAPPAAATLTYPEAISTGIFMSGFTTGHSETVAGGVSTIHAGIATTVANLDAAAGAAGFGGNAFNLGGACITSSSVNP